MTLQLKYFKKSGHQLRHAGLFIIHPFQVAAEKRPPKPMPDNP